MMCVITPKPGRGGSLVWRGGEPPRGLLSGGWQVGVGASSAWSIPAVVGHWQPGSAALGDAEGVLQGLGQPG